MTEKFEDSRREKCHTTLERALYRRKIMALLSRN